MPTKINSSNLCINLLNINDIVNAIQIIIDKNIKPKKYILKNKTTYKISDLINKFNKKNKKKIKVKWLSNKIISEKIFKYATLKKWQPHQSKMEDVFNIIKG
jgi:hypothetical protein